MLLFSCLQEDGIILEKVYCGNDKPLYNAFKNGSICSQLHLYLYLYVMRMFEEEYT